MGEFARKKWLNALLEFDFTGVELLSISKFMEKTEFRTEAMRAAKGRINVKKEMSKKSKTEVIASSVMGDMFNPYVNQGRAHIRYVCCEILKHPTFKSDLVVGLACFDNSVLFVLSRGQAMDCYARLFQSFCVRGWLPKELKNVHMDDYVEFIDDLRFVYVRRARYWPEDWGRGHIFVFKPRIVQTRVYIICVQIMLFMFGARSVRVT